MTVYVVIHRSLGHYNEVMGVYSSKQEAECWLSYKDGDYEVLPFWVCTNTAQHDHSTVDTAPNAGNGNKT